MVVLILTSILVAVAVVGIIIFFVFKKTETADDSQAGEFRLLN